MLVFRKILRTYLMDGPQMYAQKTLSYAWKNSSYYSNNITEKNWL